MTARFDLDFELFEAARVPTGADLRDGYVDLLGDEDATGPHLGQRWMASSALPQFYERVWRPVAGRLLMGAGGPDMRGELRFALEGLALTGDARVLDVGCGPGNFTRRFALAAPDGVVVGLDASRTMLARAVSETRAENVTYVLGDACALPFRDAVFDAVCCFAALYLIEDPMRALDEIARVLAPGGSVAILASCTWGPVPTAVTTPLVKGLTGVRMFERHEITGALTALGLAVVDQRVAGLAQFVAARKPPR
jgi:SAM-dependent methyltransferase